MLPIGSKGAGPHVRNNADTLGSFRPVCLLHIFLEFGWYRTRPSSLVTKSEPALLTTGRQPEWPENQLATTVMEGKVGSALAEWVSEKIHSMRPLLQPPNSSANQIGKKKLLQPTGMCVEFQSRTPGATHSLDEVTQLLGNR